VLFEEWLKLRRLGYFTPEIAIWPCSPKGSSTWRKMVKDIYNKPEYDELIYK